jgi:predicted transcriptional regulator
MKSYLQMIKDYAAERNVELQELFRFADVAVSTYHRTIKGETELKYQTAKHLYDSIDEKIKRDKHRERVKRLRENEQRLKGGKY